jgi:hypothetical protein
MILFLVLPYALCHVIGESLYVNASLLLAPQLWKPLPLDKSITPSVLSSPLIGLWWCNRQRKRLSHLRLWVRSSHWTNDTYVKLKSYSTLYWNSGWQSGLGFSPLTDLSTIAVLRDQTWVIRRLPKVPLVRLRLDQVELRPSQISLAISCK